VRGTMDEVVVVIANNEAQNVETKDRRGGFWDFRIQAVFSRADHLEFRWDEPQNRARSSRTLFLGPRTPIGRDGPGNSLALRFWDFDWRIGGTAYFATSLVANHFWFDIFNFNELSQAFKALGIGDAVDWYVSGLHQQSVGIASRRRWWNPLHTQIFIDTNEICHSEDIVFLERFRWIPTPFSKDNGKISSGTIQDGSNAEYTVEGDFQILLCKWKERSSDRAISKAANWLMITEHNLQEAIEMKHYHLPRA
jgi:hypothetical protein